MINYFEIYDLDINQTREENLKKLRAELRKQTKRSNHPKMEIRTEAQKQLKDITAAVEIFENDDSYNRYLTDLNIAQRKTTTPNNYESTESYEQQNEPQDINSILLHAENLLGIDNALAYNLIQQALSIDSFNTEAWEMYARYFDEVNQYDEKYKVLDKLETLNPDDLWLAIEQFIRYTAVYPNKENAKKYYNLIMEQLIAEKTVVSLFYTGRYNMFLQNYEEAITNFLKAEKMVNGQTSINASPYMKSQIGSLTLNVDWGYNLSEAYLLAANKFLTLHGDSVYLTTKEDALNYIKYMEQSLKYNPDNDMAESQLLHGKEVLKKTNVMGYRMPLILAAVTSILLIIAVQPVFRVFNNMEWNVFGYGLPDFLVELILITISIVRPLFKLILFFCCLFIAWLFLRARSIPVYDINMALVKSKNPYFYSFMRQLNDNRFMNRISKRDKTKT